MSEKTRPPLPQFSGTAPQASNGLELSAGGLRPTDAAARVFATDPTQNVVLEASAGTGKTSVLVTRYLNLLRADVDPSSVLAVTFTRQAAAEMRERIIHQLRREASHSATSRTRWNELRDRLGEISISTVDAFCLSLLREFPLEADLDPGFETADETEVPRLIEEAAERTLAIGTTLAQRDPGVAMLVAQLGPWRVRVALTALLERRLVVPGALHRFLAAAPRDLTGDRACRDAVVRLVDRLSGMRVAVEHLVEAGTVGDPRSAVLARDLRRLPELRQSDPATIRACLERLRDFFLTRRGAVRSEFSPRTGTTGPARRRYREAAAVLAPIVRDGLTAFDRDVNVAMVRAVQRLFGIAVSEYQRALESRALLDFSDVLRRAVDLLRQMDEFSRSRYRLESRYHHVLVDEFQDTSHTQWELVSLLVQSWGEGSGLVHEAPLPPTVFVVGDRKQSIYRFRDADVTVLQDAADEISGLRAGGDVRRSIAHSFRAVPPLLGFINDLFTEVSKASGRPDAFRFEPQDRFPITGLEDFDDADPSSHLTDDPLGVVTADDIGTCAETVADEITRLLRSGFAREKDGAGRRPVRPGDIAILFRTRESHREFERALERRSVPTYVYKGLGFFDSDEIKDVRALIRFLANPRSELRAAALLRSRFVGLSDPGLLMLAGQISRALLGPDVPVTAERLDENDRRLLERTRASLGEWESWVDRYPPAEVLDRVLDGGAYAAELRGPHLVQARENLKKMRGLVRRLQNRGYATMARVADHIDHLSGDVSNAVIEAFDAVNLMTVHAAKGLEFSVVFLVDLGHGTGMQPPPVRVIPDRGDGQPSVSVWPYRTEADADEYLRELEETKRLLYVATTRARDFLYLSTVMDGGRVKFNRGSFGEVLPTHVAALFEKAAHAPAEGRAHWRSQSGNVHTFRVCGTVPADQQDVPRATPWRVAAEQTRLTLAPLRVRPRITRVPVTAVSTIHEPPTRENNVGSGEVRQRAVGRVVHRLIHLFRGRPVATEELEQRARSVLGMARFREVGTGVEEVRAAVTLYSRFVLHDDVVQLADQQCLFEVQFSYIDPNSTQQRPGSASTVWRGTIDCLVRCPDGAMRVLEFKTGRPRPEHRRQLDLYVAAVRVMFPKTRVAGRLIYP